MYSVETMRQTAVMSFFPQIQNGEQKAYVLKNKQLTGPTKGVIYLEIDVIFNAVSLNFAFLLASKKAQSLECFCSLYIKYMNVRHFISTSPQVKTTSDTATAWRTLPTNFNSAVVASNDIAPVKYACELPSLGTIHLCPLYGLLL